MGKGGESEADANQKKDLDEMIDVDFGDEMYMGLTPIKELIDTGDDGLTDAEAERRLGIYGRNELEENEEHPLMKLLKGFFGPMPIMIWCAIILEAVTGDWSDFVVLLILQILNATIGWYEDMKAGNAVAALKASLKPEANVKRGGVYKVVPGGTVVPGDRVTIHAGAAIPADCMLCPCEPIDIDQAALTGESLPVTMNMGDKPKMGSNCTRGEAEGIVIATGSQTFFGKTASMIGSVHEEGHFQKVLMAITRSLLFISIVLVVISLCVLIFRDGEGILDAMTFAVVLLVASIPIAMPVVSVATMALGSRKLAEKKAIVTRLSSIEEVAGMDMLCSDKTGTLTLNKMVLQDELPIFTAGVTREDVLQYAALAAKWLEPPKDALDTLVLNAADISACNAYEQIDYVPFDPRTKRTASTLRDQAGSYFKASKGAPHVVLALAHDMNQIKDQVEEVIARLAERGVRSLAVARTRPVANVAELDNAPVWEFMGILTFLDPPRPDTAATIKKANQYGVGVKMITGDHKAIAVDMCHQLNMGDKIQGCEGLPTYDPAAGALPKTIGEEFGPMIEAADGFAQVFPEHKFLIVEALQQRGWMVGMTGDGVNDAPALKKAGVGIAVSGATDAARAASDIVLTDEGLGVLVDAIIIARRIFQRMKNYVIYRVSCTIQLLLFFFITVLCIHPDSYKGWDDDVPPSFKLPVIALVIITILNDGTIISIAYDAVRPSAGPEKWRLPQVFAIASVLGGVATISSILLLVVMLDSQAEGSAWGAMGLPEIENYSQLMMAIYLKISISDFLTVFAARTRSNFLSRAPGTLLFFAALVATVASTLIAVYWPSDGSEEGNEAMGAISGSLAFVIWIYDIVFFLLQDALKVGFIQAINSYTGINEDENKMDEDGEPPESILYFAKKMKGKIFGEGPVGRRGDSKGHFAPLDTEEDDEGRLSDGGIDERAFITGDQGSLNANPGKGGQVARMV
mmetsp:Transcript_38815/g.89452  ORF Transcript_38815/g.89452 Transcript_38815/m.89452 type:complete len:973 (+) Transcript_38815:139-3057(+)